MVTQIFGFICNKLINDGVYMLLLLLHIINVSTWVKCILDQKL